MGSADSPAQPSEGFGFAFNNPLAPDQDVAHYLTIDPLPQGYQGQLLESGATAVYTDNVQLLADTTYHFSLAAGLKDKWGFPVAPDSWDVTIGPLPPSLTLDGGTFQPIYSQGPSRVQIETANLDHVSLHLYRLSEDDVRTLLSGNGGRYNPDGTPTYPGTLTREWDVPVTPGAGGAATVFPTLGLDAKADRLPAGYYYLRVTAPTPYGSGPLEATSVLLVGRTGLVMKNEGKDLLVWAADLHTGQPVPGYHLRVETATGDQGFSTQQHGRTGADGVWRTTLGATSYDQLAVWGEEPGDSALLSAGWGANLVPGGYGGAAAATRAALYTDRPIYRPGQTVYFRGVYRADDDASYSVPPAGTTVSLTAQTYNAQGQTSVFTGTAKLSAAGTFSGQFVLPAGAPVGNYSLASDAASASFAVQEYRKPDFQVDVTPGMPAVIHGDPVTATIQTSYYFGGPLAAVTTTVNLQSSPYIFSWSDPDTGETYVFGEGGLPWVVDAYASSGGPYRPQPPAPVQSFQALTDQDGRLVVDVTKYVTTTDTSKSLLIEGQVQDLSNQAVAANTSVVVHQGLYYVGLRVGDYIATAKQPTTVTVRTVAPDASAPHGGRVQPNTVVHLRVVREEWVPPARGFTTWTQREVPVDSADVTTDATGRAVYRFTPPQGGSYRLIGESTDARGNLIHSSTAFWAASSDPGYIPWQFDNPQQVKLVADKPSYQAGDTAHILVTSPFTEATALLTVERGHLRRYQVITLHGGAPTIDVPLEAGDVPNVYIGLTLLGPGAAPAGAPADWGNQISLRQGYLDVPLSTAGKALHVSVAPQGSGPYAPGSTAQVRVQTTDSAGRPVAAELSLAVVDEAIYALAGDTSASLFDTFWSERGLGVRTASSFTAGDNGYYGYRDDLRLAGGAVPAAAAAPCAHRGAGERRVHRRARRPGHRAHQLPGYRLLGRRRHHRLRRHGRRARAAARQPDYLAHHHAGHHRRDTRRPGQRAAHGHPGAAAAPRAAALPDHRR